MQGMKTAKTREGTVRILACPCRRCFGGERLGEDSGANVTVENSRGRFTSVSDDYHHVMPPCARSHRQDPSLPPLEGDKSRPCIHVPLYPLARRALRRAAHDDRQSSPNALRQSTSCLQPTEKLRRTTLSPSRASVGGGADDHRLAGHALPEFCRTEHLDLALKRIGATAKVLVGIH